MVISSIPLDDPMIERIKTLVPEKYHGQTWVAGSAASRWGQHADVDVWVVGLRKWGEYADLTARLNRASPPITMTTQDNYPDGTGMLAYSGEGLQIIPTQLSTIQEVVALFDISCHAAAKHILTGEAHIHPEFCDEVRVLGWKDPVTTLGRVCKFSKRYMDHQAMRQRNVKELAVLVCGLETVLVPEGL